MTTDPTARRVLLALTGAALLLAGLLVAPFWSAVLVAAVLAAVLRPAMEWLAARLRRRRHLAAVLITVALVLAISVPLATLATVLVSESISGVAWLRAALETEGAAGLLARLPSALRPIAEQLLGTLPRAQEELQGLVSASGGKAAAAFGGVLAATGGALLQSGIALVLFYFLLVDGNRLVAWADESLPLPPGQLRTLLLEFKRTASAVLVATLGTAGIQTVAALAGYLVGRVPNVLFLTFVTFVIALIPAVGGTVVVLATGLIQLALGHTASGVFLLVWGAAVVSTVDTLARPWLLRGGMALHGGIVFFALIAGIAAFGPIGVLLGPLTVTFLLAVVRMWKVLGVGSPPSSSSANSA
ncbi:MAG TPA: AI-2E family transporter [Anaeromyxobacteraceae bacterium]|nr:AI-2E family transporter [Anaeromyxobacteraceae bacterium]